MFDKTCNNVEHKCFLKKYYYSQHNTDQNIAKEALLPVTEGKYPEWNFFHNILYSDLDLNSPTPVLKVHIFSKLPRPLIVTVLQV